MFLREGHKSKGNAHEGQRVYDARGDFGAAGNAHSSVGATVDREKDQWRPGDGRRWTDGHHHRGRFGGSGQKNTPAMLVTLFDAVIPVVGERRYEKELRKMAGTTAQDIMTTEVVVADEEMALEEVATLLSDDEVSLLPVLRGETVVGIIGKRDIIRAILARDEMG